VNGRPTNDAREKKTIVARQLAMAAAAEAWREREAAELRAVVEAAECARCYRRTRRRVRHRRRTSMTGEQRAGKRTNAADR